VLLVVETRHGVAAALAAKVGYSAPGIFTLNGMGSGQGVAELPGNSGVAMIRNREVTGQPAAPGDLVTVYATGIDGLANVKVDIGGVDVAPAWIGAVPDRPGLTRIAVTVPEGAWEDGDLPLSITGNAPDGTTWRSNVVTIAFEGVIR
jgi:uncharacterized protein (TIGR03437 family)